jgi:acyl-coenzyme A synthetase/AMP-(fatty) acid ligase
MLTRLSLKRFSTIYTSLLATQSPSYKASVDPKERVNFWLKQSSNLSWFKPPSLISDNGPLMFFEDGELNLSYNCLDRHLAENSNGVAIIYDSGVSTIKITYAELHKKVQAAAYKMRKDFKIGVNDIVLIYMNNSPEAIISLLACARLGAIHAVMYSHLSSHELLQRIKQLEPKLIITTNHSDGITNFPKNIAQAIETLDSPSILTFPGNLNRNDVGKAFTWYEEEAFLDFEVQPISLPSKHNMYILETSGTLGHPKGFIRDIGGTSVYLDWCMKNHFGIVGKNNVFYNTIDLGWVYGHHFSVYGTLIAGGTTLISERLPSEGNRVVFWENISNHKVEGILTFPRYIKQIKKFDTHGENIESFNLSTLKTFTVTGEKCSAKIFHWLKNHLNDDVLLSDCYMQSETGFPIFKKVSYTNISNSHNREINTIGAGYQITITDDQENIINSKNTLGKIKLELPLPPGFVNGIYMRDQTKFKESFFKNNLYATGDSGFIDENLEIHIGSRTDDIIKIEGYRLSTSFMEEMLEQHRMVKKAVVIEHRGDSDLPYVFVILKKDANILTSVLESELIHILKNDISPILGIKRCIVVQAVPKNKNGMVLRHILRSIVQGEKFVIPDNIVNPTVIKDIEETVLGIMN